MLRRFSRAPWSYTRPLLYHMLVSKGVWHGDSGGEAQVLHPQGLVQAEYRVGATVWFTGGARACPQQL